MTTDDIKQYLKDNLSIECDRADWTMPNQREINLILDGEVISRVSFDVVQTREYEG
jgi:hypothetical protein